MVDRDIPGLGTAFDVDVRVPFGTMTLRYKVITWEPPSRVVARAETSTLTSLDEIVVQPTIDDSTVTYDAHLSLRGIVRLANPGAGFTDNSRADLDP